MLLLVLMSIYPSYYHFHTDAHLVSYRCTDDASNATTVSCAHVLSYCCKSGLLGIKSSI